MKKKSWKQIGLDHWFDYLDLYDWAVDRLRDGSRIVEVGSWLGRSLCYLADRVKESGKRVEIFSVDRCYGPYDDKYMDAVIRDHCGSIAGGLHANLIACDVVDLVTLIVTDSTKAAKLFPDGSLDFVFIDAAHDYENVSKDLRAWWPKVAAGGIFAGHDYDGNGWDDVKKAVDEFCERYSFQLTPLSKNCWGGIKPSPAYVAKG